MRISIINKDGSLNADKIPLKMVINNLQQYKDRLKSLYVWNPDTKSLIEILEKYNNSILPELINKIVEIHKQEDLFVKNLELKKAVSDLVNYEQIKCNNELLYSIYEWIVVKFGNIRRFDKKSMKGAINFIDQLEKNSSTGLDRVASFSKIASFWRPSDYVIYDARVAYTLNWLLLRNKSDVFFPEPSASANTQVSGIDIYTIIRFHKKENYLRQEKRFADRSRVISNCDKSIFISDDNAYTEYCTLIKEIHSSLFNDDNLIDRPFYTEMLLFGLVYEACKGLLTDIHIEI